MRIAKIVGRLVLIFMLGSLLQNLRAQSQIHVGPNVQVSKANETLQHDEVLSCADPHHAERLLVGSVVNYFDRWAPWTIAYVSFDGGKTWSTAVENQVYAGEVSMDPACAYAPDGAAYFVATGGKAGSHGSAFYRSPDGGKNWLPPTIIYGAGDRPYVSVDRSGGKYDGRVYVNHTTGARDLDGPIRDAVGIGVQRSIDRAQTFLGPVSRLGLAGVDKEIVNPGNGVVLSDGTFVSLLIEFTSDKDGRAVGKIEVVSSSDGGEHLNDAVKVGDYSAGPRDPLTIPNVAVDPGSSVFKDRLYTVWQNSGNDSDNRDYGEVSFISYSGDNGNTWSKPRRIDNAREKAQGTVSEYQSTVAASKEGVVGVMWYDGFELSDTSGYWVRFAASLDGGETWLPSVLVSESPMVFGGTEKWQFNGEASKADGNRSIELRLWPFKWLSSGDTAGLTADSDGTFHAFWIDNRSGISQVWTAPITVVGSVVKNGAKELANLEDISSKVQVEITSINLDRPTGKLTAAIRLKNISEVTIRSPLMLRILDLDSEFGIPRSVNSENGLVGAGAILALSDLLHGGTLKPKQESSQKVVEFRIENLGPQRSSGQWHTDLLNLNARVFGKVQP